MAEVGVRDVLALCGLSLLAVIAGLAFGRAFGFSAGLIAALGVLGAFMAALGVEK